MTDVSSWHEGLGRAAGLHLEARSGPQAMTRFRDIDGRIEQPALDATVLSIHLGGPKRVIRRQGRATLEADIRENAFTLMPAGEAFSWETFGPVDFAHLPLDQDQVRGVAIEEFDRDPDPIRLEPVLGADDRRVADLLRSALASGGRPRHDRLRHDAISVALCTELLARYAGRHPTDAAGRTDRGKLATWQLRRVTDYMRAHLAEDIALATLVALTGLGRARFFDAFRTTMGRTPFAFLLHLRLLQARILLTHTDLSVTEIALDVGLGPTRLAVAFRRAFGMSPRAYRQANAP